MTKPFTSRRLFPIGVAICGLLLFLPPLGSMRPRSPVTAPPPSCVSDADCADGIFCNGIERCSGADPGVCVAGRPPCGAGQRCDEDRDQCVTSCADPDHDQDGHRSISCGGDDCDDRDANRYPGRQEVCDAAGHDEDCDPASYGVRDIDEDGENDIRCFNREANGAMHHGTDYDDHNPAVRVGSMICDGPDGVVVSGSKSFPCPDGTKCVAQPNGTGVCGVPPANYVSPPAFVRVSPPSELPALGTLVPTEGGGQTVPGGTGTTPERTYQAPVKVVPQVVIAVPSSASGDNKEVAQCKEILQSGKISWGGGTNWAQANIDSLCNGTKDARGTIACFESNVAALAWQSAIEKCK